MLAPRPLLAGSGGVVVGSSGGGTVIRAADFVAKIGFNTNLNSGDSPSAIIAALTYLGVYRVRDSIWGGTNHPTAADWASSLFAPLTTSGTPLQAHLGYQGPPSSPSYPMTSWISELKSQLVTPYPGGVIAVAGPNEPDNQGFMYSDGTGGPTGAEGIAGANLAQPALFAAIKGDPALSSIFVDEWPSAFSFSGNFSGFFNDMIDQTSISDRQNGHFYYSANMTDQPTFPADGPIYNALLDPSAGYLRNNSFFCHHPQFVVTESGWNMPWSSGGQPYISLCDQRAQPRLLLCDILDHCSMVNCRGFFIFRLLSPAFYGVMNSDGSAAPTGTILKSFFTILADTGGAARTFSPLPFAPVISGMPSQSGSAVLAKSDGGYFIALWNETPFFNSSTGADVPVTSSSVTVTLPASRQVLVYDPVNSGTTPIATIGPQLTFTVALNDAPLILAVQHP